MFDDNTQRNAAEQDHLVELFGANTLEAAVELSCRVKDAIGVLMSYGSEDGAHHKQWAIDQALRKLTGPAYADMVTFYENDGEYKWDTGIAP